MFWIMWVTTLWYAYKIERDLTVGAKIYLVDYFIHLEYLVSPLATLNQISTIRNGATLGEGNGKTTG